MISTKLTLQNSRNKPQATSWFVRPTTNATEDQHFLTSMCYISVFPTRTYPFLPEDEKVIERLPQIHPWRYAWGRPGDLALLAIDISTEKPLGAIWCRLFPSADIFIPGFSDNTIPILSLAIVPEARHQGIGCSLLCALKHLAYLQGYTTLSLGVSIKNPARLLYQRMGFQDQHAVTSHGPLTMFIMLSDSVETS